MATDKELAQLALHVYDTGRGSPDNRPLLPAGWEKVLTIPDKVDGFSYGVYQSGGETVISFAGTNSGIDWLANGSMFAGLSSCQLLHDARRGR